MVGIYCFQRKPTRTAGDVTCVFVVSIKVTVKIGWMDELGVHVLFNSISVVSERWKGEHERLYAMKRRLGSNSGFRTDDPVVRSRER